MSGGGAKPGERRGGRQKGTKNRKTVEREIIEAEVLRGKIAAGIAASPPMGKATLEELLRIALTRMHEAMAGGEKTYEAFLAWFDRTFVVARELTKYQSPQLRAIAVAHTPMTPPRLDLSRLSDEQVKTLASLIVLAQPVGPANGRADQPVESRPARVGNGEGEWPGPELANARRRRAA